MRRELVMVYPKQGFSGVFVKHSPISLLYAVSELVKEQIPVKIFDARLYPNDWKEKLREIIGPGTLAVGISVMSGRPIENAIEVSRWVKAFDPDIKIVWGGPHVTFSPDSCFDEPTVDYAISGYASKSLAGLVKALLAQSNLAEVAGLSFRGTDDSQRITRNPEIKTFEKIPFVDIPYHLIDDYRPYGQLDQKKDHFFHV